MLLSKYVSHKDRKQVATDDMFGDDGLLQQLTKAVVERALQGEMTHHLGYEKHASEGKNSGNSCNGKSSKTIKGKRGQALRRRRYGARTVLEF